jgi:hypothetical protein
MKALADNCCIPLSLFSSSSRRWWRLSISTILERKCTVGGSARCDSKRYQSTYQM